MTLPADLPADLAELLATIAKAAGAELRRRFEGPRDVLKKGAIDLVTDADRASEALVLELLQKAHPQATILAEESGGRAGSDLRFIVDPLDGTTNYAHGIPHFCVTLAADDPSGLLAGAIYDPCRDELYLASRGGGATVNGRPLRVLEAALDDAVLATGFPYDVRTRADPLFDWFHAFVTRSRAVRRFGSAALDLAWTAQGRFHGYWERGVKPWDVAAGLLLVREAGGVCLDYAGREAAVDAGEVIAAPAALAREMAAVIGLKS